MRMQHLTGAPQIDLVDERSARSRCLYQVLMAHGVDHWGRYVDELVIVDGRWRFLRRQVTVDGFVAGGFAAAIRAQ